MDGIRVIEKKIEEEMTSVTQALEGTFECHDFLSSKQLKSECEAQYKKAMEHFTTLVTSCSTPSTPEQTFKLKSVLSNQLRRLFLQFLIENQEKKSTFVENIIQHLTSEYENTVLQEIGEKTCLVEELNSILALAKAKIKMEFGQKCGPRESAFFSEVLPKFNSVLENIDSLIHSKNASKLTEKELEYEEVIEKSQEQYEELVEMFLMTPDSKTRITEESILNVHEKCQGMVQKKFKSAIHFDNPKLEEVALNKLQTKVNQVLDKVSREVLQAQVEAAKAASEIVAQIVKSYVESMESAINAESSDSRIQKEHHMQLITAKNSVIEIYHICGTDEANRQKEMLVKSIEEAFIQIKNKIELQKSNLNEKWNQGISQATTRYGEIMTTKIGGPRLLTKEELIESSRIIENEFIHVACTKLNWLPSKKTKKFKSELKHKLGERLNEIVGENQIKIQQIIEEITQQFSEWLDLYNKDMVSLFTGDMDFITMDQLHARHQTASEKAKEILFQKCEILPKPVFLKLDATLTSSLEDNFLPYRDTIQSRLNQRQDDLMNCTVECLEIYTKGMESSQLLYWDDEQLQEIHNSSLVLALSVMDLLSTKILKGVSISVVEEAKEKLQQEIETEFQTQLNKLQIQLQKKDEELRTLKETAKEFYNDVFQTKLKEEEIQNEVDLGVCHHQVLFETIKQYEMEFPDSYTIQKFLEQRESLKDEIQHEYAIFLKDFHEKSDIFDATIKKTMRDIAEGFKSNVDKTFQEQYSYLANEQLQLLEEMYEKAVQDGLIKVQSYTKGGPVNVKVNPESYERQLIESLQTTLELVKTENTLKKQRVEEEVMDSIKQTKSELLRKLLTMNDPEPHMPNLVAEYTNKFTSMTRCNYKLPDSEFLNNYVNPELEKVLHTAYEEWMTEMEPEADKLELNLLKAIEIYNKEMNGRINPEQCLSPKTLEDFHRRAVLEAKKKFAIEIPQTTNVRKKFETALIEPFRKYKDRNSLQAAELVDAVIGIDLGTTNSCVSVYRNKKAEMIPDRNTHKNVVPSYVLFKSNEEVVIGESAKDQSVIYPNLTIFDAKRLIGRKFEDPVTQKDIELWPFEVVNDMNRPKVKVQEKTYFPEEISAKILKKLKEDAEVHLGCEINSAVITVPAHFNDAQKQATRNAGDLAGLKVLQLINEPTSAAIAYSLNYTDNKRRTILVYDLGGGTFDISILEVQGGNIVVKAVGGDTHLGGEDFDNNLVTFCIDKFRQSHDLSINDDDTLSKNEKSRKLRRIRHKCEQAKINLSVPNAKSAKVVVDRIYESVDMEVDVTLEDFNKMNEPLFQKTIQSVQQVLKEAKLNELDIDDVVLVGGSTRIPRIQKLLEDLFNGKTLNMSMNPDEVVAQGAAIYAAILSGSKAGSLGTINFSDVTPISLGVEIIGDRFSIIIPKNTTVPVEITETYYTIKDFQTTIPVDVYEGEDENFVFNNNHLGGFLLKGVPSNLRGEEKIDVTMSCDREGLLHVKAVCRSTGGNKEVEIQSERFGLTQEEIALLKERVQESNSEESDDDESGSEESHDFNPSA